MKNKLKKSKSFWNNFIMDKNLKAGLITKNLHRLGQLEHILFAFGIIMTGITFVHYKSDLKNHLPEFFYYFAYVLTSVHVLISVIHTNHHPEWPVWRRNIPTYIALFEVLVLSLIVLYFSSSPISPYTVYTNVCIIAIVLFAVEPAYFISLLFLFSFVIIYRLWKNGDVFVGLNVLLTTMVMSALNLFKWNSLIKEFKLERVRDSHLEAIENEINLAAFVQESFSKKKLPELNGFQILSYSKAMAGVSGDMYDFYTDGNELKGLGIFDVSGHGISSGLVTMLVRNIIQQEFYQNYDKPLEDVMEIIDKRIKKEKRDIENYLTGILIRTKGNKIEIVNAGHPCPILYNNNDKKCIYFDEDRLYASSAIGLSALDFTFKSTSFLMEKGDELVLYTDGVKEAMNSEHNEYGKTRLFISVHNAMSKDFSSQMNMILSDMGMFTEDTSQNDDITIVIIKKT